MKKKDKKPSKLRRFMPYYGKYKGIMTKDLLCAALTTICELLLPLLVREVTTRAGGSQQELTVNFVLTLGAVYLVMRIIDAAAYYYMASVGHVMGARIETDMRRDLFSHLQLLPFKYYDNTKVGTLMSRITSDLFDVTEFAHHCPEEFFIAGIKILVSFIILCTMSVPLTLIVFAVIPPMFFVLYYFNKRMHKGFRDQRKEVGELNAAVEDSLLGVRVVRSYAGEDIEQKKFNEGNQRFLKIKAKNYKYMGGFQSSTRFFEGFMYIIVVVVGALFMINKVITAPEYIAYILYVTTLFATIRKIVEFAEQFQRGMTGIERFFEIMDTDPDIVDAQDAKPIENVKGEIEFCDVTFRYSAENEEVLTNVSFKVKPGENIALVGPSGGGKTTICSLIPRFYEADSGTILVDGTDIRKATLSSLRKSIGVVQQDVYLFSGSVYENIEYGCPGATKEEIEKAAKLAGAHEFIAELPEGYNTYVGERGVKLSGGQKQRISIARVFLKNPPILLLDEATSALDNESEFLVQKSLQELSKGRTTITVAHRLTTIKGADRIFVITKNGIAEEGTHEQLMNQNGIYSSLYKAYAQ